MKRIGLISDPHGNLLALDAVLAELEQDELDGLICLGDVSAGPQPAETLARVRELGCPIVKGNWDEWFCDGFPAAQDDTARKLFEIGESWVGRMSAGDLELMRGFAPTVQLDLGDGATALCFHGSPSSHMEGIYSITPEETLAGYLGDAATPVLLCGHTHVQMVRRHEDSLVVNPGSVGLPFLSWTPHEVRVAPWAEYGVLAWEEEGRLNVELRRATYDVAAFLDLAQDSGMPHARWWVDSWQRDAA